MKVVLLEEVPNLGGPGAVKDVANGYARNYLLPRKLATPATPGALKRVEQAQAAEVRRQAKADAEAAGLAGRIQGQEVVFRVRAGEEGRLYGSVTNTDIAQVLSRQMGEEIDRRKVVLETPIHTLGAFEVPVRLSAGHAPVVRVIVESETAQAAQPAPQVEPPQPADAETLPDVEPVQAVELAPVVEVEQPMELAPTVEVEQPSEFATNVEPAQALAPATDVGPEQPADLAPAAELAQPAEPSEIVIRPAESSEPTA